MRSSLVFLCLFCFAACAQPEKQAPPKPPQHVGGRCEGCEAIYESPVPFKNLADTDTLPDFSEEGPKLVVSGTVYKADGKTPAPGVVLYVYHTDQTGRYRTTSADTGWGRRHGNIRGWVKTNASGQYRFYTLRPAPYSAQAPPAHIHLTVKEPDKNEYWLDDFRFDDDPMLTPELRRGKSRGGSGILKLTRDGSLFAGHRDIYLGRNIENY